MTVPKNYRSAFSCVYQCLRCDSFSRDSSDDGLLCALLLGPIISAAELYSSLKSVVSGKALPDTWLIEAPKVLSQSQNYLSANAALVLSRRNLVDLATLCSLLLLTHVCASWWAEASQKRTGIPETERASVPRSEMQKAWLYASFSVMVSMTMFGIRMAMGEAGWGIWQREFY
jgi:dolichol kinase